VIPRAHITAWRSRAPWPADEQIEQDLVLSRALVAIFEQPAVSRLALFRGGTALHKLFFESPRRYSEDLDLVQHEAAPIGELVAGIRGALDSWLGAPKWKQGEERFTLVYRFETTIRPVIRMRVKIEINTREHFAVLGITRRRFEIENPWFTGGADLPVYELDELLGTKLRALYQRKKGRDLYDLSHGLRADGVDPARVILCFQRYMSHGGVTPSRAEFEANLAAKLADSVFLEDLAPLIPADERYEVEAAADEVRRQLISRLSGRSWKGW
jgi:predicted nucleotidyltransferase component of viral defense system